MGLYQITLQIPLIKLEDYNMLIREIIKHNPELLGEFVKLPNIKPKFKKYVEEHQKSPSNKQEGSKPKLNGIELAFLSLTGSGRER